MNDRQIIRLKKVKDELLTNCEICGGTGIIKFRKGLQKRCQCFEKFLRIKRLVEANIPEKYWDFSLRDFISDRGGNSVQVYWKVRKYLRHLKKAKRLGLGILFAGDMGVGKTFLACCILKKAIDENFSAKYLRFEDLIFQAKSKSLEELSEIKRELAEADFLVLDDIGQEYHKVGSTYAASELLGLFKIREAENNPTILTTSLTKKEFIETYGKTSAILFSSSLKPIEILRPNFQKQILEKKWNSLKKGD